MISIMTYPPKRGLYMRFSPSFCTLAILRTGDLLVLVSLCPCPFFESLLPPLSSLLSQQLSSLTISASTLYYHYLSLPYTPYHHHLYLPYILTLTLYALYLYFLHSSLPFTFNIHLICSIS